MNNPTNHFVMAKSCLVWGVLLLVFMAATEARSAIIANFVDGNTNLEVDGYQGMAGDGWSTSWGTYLRRSGSVMSLTGNVLTSGDPGYTQLTGGSGNYLSVTSTYTGDLQPAYTQLWRTYDADFGSISRSAPHTISFLFRLDSGSADLLSNPAIDFFNSINEAAYPTTQNSTAFGIRLRSGVWRYYQGDGTTKSLVGTDSNGLAFYEGDTFQFTVDLDPVLKQYSLTIANLDHATNNRPGPSSYSSAVPVGFVGNDYYGATPLDTVPGRLNFTTHLQNGNVTPREVIWSLDSISIIPEPNTALLLMVGVGALILRRRLARGAH